MAPTFKQILFCRFSFFVALLSMSTFFLRKKNLGQIVVNIYHCNSVTRIYISYHPVVPQLYNEVYYSFSFVILLLKVLFPLKRKSSLDSDWICLTISIYCSQWIIHPAGMAILSGWLLNMVMDILTEVALSRGHSSKSSFQHLLLPIGYSSLAPGRIFQACTSNSKKLKSTKGKKKDDCKM